MFGAPGFRMLGLYGSGSLGGLGLRRASGALAGFGMCGFGFRGSQDIRL